MSLSESHSRIDYVIDRARKRVRTTFYGPVTADQIEAYLRTLEADPEYEYDFDVIVDLRQFQPTLSREDLHRIALLVRKRPPHIGSRHAVLVSDEQTLNLTRMFEGLTILSPVIYHAFESESAAEAWLAERPKKPGTPF